MYCKYCGTQVPDGSTSCETCASLKHGTNGNQQSNVDQKNPYGQPNGYQQNPYGQPNGYQQNPYGQPNGYQQNPCGQPNGYQQNPYGQPNGYQQNPYGQHNGYQQNPYGQANGYQQTSYGQPNGYLQSPYLQSNNQAQNSEYNPADPSLYYLGWYKYLIYFSLFSAAVSHIISGLVTLAGGYYGDDAEYYYEMFIGLQTIDIIIGIGYIALGIFAIYVRFQLADFKANSPMLLNYLYICSLALSGTYLIAGSYIAPDIFLNSNLVTQFIRNIIVMVIMICVNIKYFNNRKELFVN